MNPSDQKWPRLAAAARRAPDPRDLSAPVGFATRVAALLAVVCVASNYSTLMGALGDETADDPVAEIVDLAA